MLTKNFLILVAALLLQILAITQTFNLYAQQPKVIIGYVGGYRGLVNTSLIKANELTHINYAFVDVRNNRAWLHRAVTDTINFRHLNLLKQQNPSLKILISIGGWTWSKNFSDAVLTDTSRQKFAASAVDIIKKYGMDGIDIDWEYPARSGYEGNIYRPADKQNYTLMFKELRKQLDSLQLKVGRKYLLTTAAGAFKSFLDNTEMGDAQQYLNYINLMTYDFSGGKIASHHTPLYATTAYKAQNNSDNAVKLFIAAGVPKNKLVLGVAFYGRTVILAAGSKGLGDSVATYSKGFGFTTIKDSILKQPGNKVYKDRQAKAPYMFNKITRQFITYDDLWSVKKKCKYIRKQKLAGVMFWEYDSDLQGYLLGEINSMLR